MYFLTKSLNWYQTRHPSDIVFKSDNAKINKRMHGDFFISEMTGGSKGLAKLASILNSSHLLGKN